MPIARIESVTRIELLSPQIVGELPINENESDPAWPT
jgi:hypothetical protein